MINRKRVGKKKLYVEGETILFFHQCFAVRCIHRERPQKYDIFVKQKGSIFAEEVNEKTSHPRQKDTRERSLHRETKNK